MLKMADACQDSTTSSGNKQTRFHEMYVQRHNNVSILYADIVNFTPLSEQLSASDLVATLNELFGKFDQLAQVSHIVHITFLSPRVEILVFVHHNRLTHFYKLRTGLASMLFSSTVCNFPKLRILNGVYK